MKKSVLTVAALWLAASAAAQDRDFSKVEIKATQVAGSVWILEGAGGNIGASIGEDGIVIVDDQFAPLAPKIREALAQITDKPVKFVLNTHWHGDHVGGNERFGETSTIIAHSNVRKRLKEGGSVLGRKIEPAPKTALPIITFDEGLTVHLNGEDVKAIHYVKGHTDGDAIIYFTESNVVHMGDDFVTYGFPFIDLESGGSVKGMIDCMHKVIPGIPAGAKIIPGHGPVSTIADVKTYTTMLEETYAIVAKGVRAGKSVDQLKKEKVLAAYDKYSGDFVSSDKFIETIYADITQRPAPGGPTRHH